jgi:NADH dehydrogenase
MILVVGATGFLGHDVCRRLRAAGKTVRGLTRATASSERLGLLRELGVSSLEADLKSPGSLERACAGVTTVISTATSSLSRQPGDSIEAVDLRGHLHLIDIARKAGVSQFVYVSFAPIPIDFPLQTAKRAVEQELLQSGMSYTILRPTLFMDVWLSPVLGFNPSAGEAQVFGSGERPTNWIAARDVAHFVSSAVDNSKARNRTFTIGGPGAVSPLEAIKVFEGLGAPRTAVRHVPEAALEQQLAAATDPLQRSVAALMLTAARGQVVEVDAALEAAPVQLTSLQQYAREILSIRN